MKSLFSILFSTLFVLAVAVGCSSSEESSNDPVFASADNTTTDNSTTDNTTTTDSGSTAGSGNTGGSGTSGTGATDNTSSSTATSSAPTCTPTNITGYKLPDTGQTTNLVGSVGDGEDSDTTINAPCYVDNSDGTVSDNNTGLMWQQQDDGSTYTYANAGTYCSTLSLASYTDWRLPDEVELQSIVDYGKTAAPAIDETAFPSTQSLRYWTSTVYAPLTTVAWYVDFGIGSVGNSNQAGTNYVRCVR